MEYCSPKLSKEIYFPNLFLPLLEEFHMTSLQLFLESGTGKHSKSLIPVHSSLNVMVLEWHIFFTRRGQ